MLTYSNTQTKRVAFTAGLKLDGKCGNDINPKRLFWLDDCYLFSVDEAVKSSNQPDSADTSSVQGNPINLSQPADESLNTSSVSEQENAIGK